MNKPVALLSSAISILLALLWWPPSPAYGQHGQRDSRLTAANKRQQLDDILTRYTAFGFAGTVLVAEKGKVLLYKGYGLADRQRHIPNTTATIFPFASIGKGFTAAAIYKLEAEGKLNTGDPINKYLANVPSYAARITLLHLLTHSSGISHEADNVPAGATPDEYVANVLRLPLQSEPGARYSYSNTGFGLLDVIVERVTDATFESYLRNNLLRPAGLFHTGWRSEFQSRLFARGYQDQYHDSKSEITFPGRFSGNGGLVGTPAELYKWSEMLYTNRVLPPIARTKLFTPAFDEFVNGWWVTRTKQGVELQMTDGDFLGYSTLAGWRNLIYLALRDVLLGEKYEPPPLVKKIDEAQLDHLSGKYQLSSGATLEVRAANDSLHVTATGQEAVSALVGVDAAMSMQLIDRDKVTTDIIVHIGHGDFDWLKSITEFQSPEPFQRLRTFWSTMIATKGQLKGSQIISSPSRGGLIQTHIRFDLERGTEYWLLLWSEGKMRGWSIDVSAPTPTVFLATSPNEFASLDVPTRKITRIQFQEKEGGLLIPVTSGGQVLARKVN